MGMRFQCAPDHHAYKLALFDNGKVDLANLAPIAKHGRAGGNAVNFFEFMRDINDRHAALAQCFDDFGQLFKFARCQTGGWLVHSNDGSFRQQRLGNFDNLTLRHSQVADLGGNFNCRIQHGQNLACFCLCRCAIDDDAHMGRRDAQKHVLNHIKLRHLLQFLMDHGDARQARGLW